ncbi:MFS transporter [Paenibacillus sp. HN-1]|uniref:MFS transporter n=1 Tax=Paenibacillus TaxID=44249 RepID=UPI001CA95BAB|nr:MULTISPECIES: MFS transporter [Paenibacillus]MBY9081967.1 MFS transporter [Paenibacillus sp. CGMCC 1.18879]MBY9085875.1 MFS transporter [Paenibacillus sinensis]
MNKKAVRAWIMYDWANSAYATTVLAAVLPIFYSSVAADGLDKNTAASYLAYTHAVGMALVALLSPVLGAVSDLSGKKTSLLTCFSLLGMVSTVCFALVERGDWLVASALLVLSTIGFAGSNSFYDSMLPDLVPSERRDEISARGYAAGYVGGGLLLAVNLVMIQMPSVLGLSDSLAGTRLAFVSVGLWWLVFALPIMRRVPNLPRQSEDKLGAIGYMQAGIKRIAGTYRDIRRYPQLFKLIAAFWFYNDGINTIILMATIYGATIGIGTSDLIIALLITQFVGIPSTLLLGRAAGRFGAKRTLIASLLVYVLIVALGFGMTKAVHFYALAILVGLVQGGSQSISRAMLSDLMPAHRTGELFGFVNITSKFSSIFGPFVFGLVGQLTGSPRLGILSLLLFFGLGIAIVSKVNVEQGKKDGLVKSEADSYGLRDDADGAEGFVS